MKGRKPTSDAVKRSRGTAQPVRMRGELQGLDITDISSIDPLLKSSLLINKRQKDVFREKCVQLIELKQLKSTDIDMLVLYSKTMDEYIIAQKKLRKEGLYLTISDAKGNEKIVINPYKAQSDKASDMLVKLSSIFGFSPVDRLKLKADNSQDNMSLMKMLSDQLK